MLALVLTLLSCSDSGSNPNDDIDNRIIAWDTDSDTYYVSDSDSNNTDTTAQLEELLNSADCLQGEIPSDSCIGGDLYTFSENFTLIDNKCNFSFRVTKCENGCTDTSIWQEEAHCSNDCDDKVCISTTEPICIYNIQYDKDVLYTYPPGLQGVCRDNRCSSYGTQNILEEKICENACVINPDGPDYCE
jgi:hypothetical protein